MPSAGCENTIDSGARYLEPKAKPAARVSSPQKVTVIPPVMRRSRRDEKAEREMVEFRRRLDAAGPHADFERIHKAMMFELGYERLDPMAVR